MTGPKSAAIETMTPPRLAGRRRQRRGAGRRCGGCDDSDGMPPRSRSSRATTNGGACSSPPAYKVLRQHGTERPFTSPLNDEKRKGTFACAGCDLPLFCIRDQIRKRHRLAELLPAAAQRGRHLERPLAADRAHRGALPALRRPSRPRVRGRPAADRAALLHQRRRADVRAGGRRRPGLSAAAPGKILPGARRILPGRGRRPFR